MKKNITLSIFEVVGSPLCVASDDGQRVHDRIAAALKEGSNVAVSFLNVSSLTSAFLNAAIGQLYGSFTENQIRSRLTVKDIQPDDLALLKRVVETAKQYFKDPKRFNKAVQDAVGDGGDDKKR
ncbi:MAG: STAS-like domain-containing protein [Deltaproteobacteria bacterium]|nr:STAS-like domain-containing protein [Deltaproteobacteria bacterium]MBI2997166.1 STAS-like domain-containing protein [Deltaproteobacteria bacterium]